MLNTCSPEGLVALTDENVVHRVKLLPMRKTSEYLMPAVYEVMQGTPCTELTGLGVVVGPGSFTGARAGLSVAKGLCDATGINMIAMSRLDLLASTWLASGKSVAFLDAGNGCFFCGVYQAHERIREIFVRRDELSAFTSLGPWVTSDAVVKQDLGDSVHMISEPGADAIFRLMRVRACGSEWSDAATSDVTYLRSIDAFS